MKKYRIDYEERTPEGIKADTIIRIADEADGITECEIMQEFFAEHPGEILSLSLMGERI